ncbi:DUF2125 domain-containing protein [Paracoccus indicus]|uniref:DUF2125 domain-containing protein n=1 Tax=Paracoccus indicus TaxID=2079229 RepID=UPI0013B40528|nr:DUF2125 domain-containing protein [Paracoccus indicus]
MYRPIATSVIALVVGAGPVLADVTPAQVWDSLQQTYGQMGYDMQIGATDDAGQTLTVTDLVLTPRDAQGDMSLSIPKITMQQTGGGDVRSVIDGQMDLQMKGQTDDDKPVGFTLSIDAPGNETLTTGTPDAMQHAFTVPKMIVNGRSQDKVNETPVTVTLTDMTASQSTTKDADGTRSQSFEGAVATTVMAIKASGPAHFDPADLPEGAPRPDPENPPMDDFASDITIEDLTFNGKGTLPSGDFDMASDPSGALKAGYSGDVTFALGNIQGDFDASSHDVAEDRVNKAQGTFGAQNGTVSMAMDKESLRYDGEAEQIAVSMTSDDLPFAIEYTAAENTMRLAMPMIASDQEQPFALAYGLKDLALNDQIWQAIDPQSTLPHDPASLNIDLEGTAVLVTDFMDPDFADPESDKAPFLPRQLSIKDISLDAVGATADVTGDLTFGDNPSQPVGKVQGSFTGINALLDNAVAMGIAPEQQMMGLRMMLAMFARPSQDDPETLTTELEFREGGSIFANGQQVK